MSNQVNFYLFVFIFIFMDNIKSIVSKPKSPSWTGNKSHPNLGNLGINTNKQTNISSQYLCFSRTKQKSQNLNLKLAPLWLQQNIVGFREIRFLLSQCLPLYFLNIFFSCFPLILEAKIKIHLKKVYAAFRCWTKLSWTILFTNSNELSKLSKLCTTHLKWI